MQFSIFTFLIRVLFPQTCLSCQKPGLALCERCTGLLPQAQNLSPNTYAVFAYEHPLVRKAIRDLKYARKSELAHILIKYASASIVEHLSDIVQGIGVVTCVCVPVPTSSARVRERGFNQSAYIAHAWARALPNTEYDACLKKQINTKPQAKLSRSARLQNIKHTMCCTKDLHPERIYLVIDDVITTGATCAEAVRALKARGARKVYSIALAHGYARP